MGDCQTYVVSICPPCIWTPLIHLDTPIYSASFNRVFILLYHKMFSYFRGSHGGLSDLEGVHMPLSSYTPIHLDTPVCSESFNRVFNLLFHKIFPTLEAVMGVVRLRGYPCAPYVHMSPVCFKAPICVDIPYMFRCPICLNTPICSDAPKCMGASKCDGVDISSNKHLHLEFDLHLFYLIYLIQTVLYGTKQSQSL